jgi:hypothetical protein
MAEPYSLQPNNSLTRKEDAVAKGDCDAFSYRLAEHEISFPELLEDAISDVFAKRLEKHALLRLRR